jgi:hypothetical protein
MNHGFALRQELADEKLKEARYARIEQLENEVFERAVGVVNAALAFVEVTPEQEEPPETWIAEFGLEQARQRLKIAKMGYLPASVAPNGFKLALQAQTGITRGRAYRVKMTQNTLNVKISLPAPTTVDHPGPTVYEVREMET